MKLLVLLQVVLIVLCADSALSQISESDIQRGISDNKAFFESSVVGQSYSFLCDENDSTIFRLHLAEDSLILQFDGVGRTPLTFQYHTRFNDEKGFTIELMVESEIVLRLYGELVEKENSGSIYVFPSERVYLNFDRSDWIVANGYLLVREDP